MKTILQWICCAVLTGILLCGGSAFAVSGQIERLTPDSPDYEELIGITERVVHEVNLLQEYDDSGITSDVTAADIDWSLAYKVYADESDIYGSFAQQSMTYDKIQSSMEYYVWVLPISVQQAHLSVTIGIGQPLTQDDLTRGILTSEQIEQIKADEGKWCPSVIEELSYDKTAEWYEQQLHDVYSGTMQRVFLMGGSPKLRSAVAVIEDADNTIQIVVLEEPRLIGTPTDGAKAPELGKVYSMEAFSEMLDSYTLNNANSELTYGAESDSDTIQSPSQPAAVLLVLALAVFGIGLLIGKRIFSSKK